MFRILAAIHIHRMDHYFLKIVKTFSNISNLCESELFFLNRLMLEKDKTKFEMETL